VFERAAKQQPEQAWRFVLVEEGREETTTLAALALRSRAFADELSVVAAERAPVVALILPNVAAAVTGCFGTLAAGGVGVPVSLRESRDSTAALLARIDVSDIVLGETDAERLGWAEGFLAESLVRRVWTTAPDGAVALHGALTDDRPAHRRGPPEEGVCIITYTSGSTAEPKIVLCGDDQLLAEREFRDVLVTRGPSLVPSPVGHITGMLNLLVFPLMRPDPIVSMDRWDASVAVDLCRRYGCTELRGTSVYVQQMLAVAPDLGGLKSGVVGGGPVAPATVRRCDEAGVRLVRAYGSTEHPTVTSCVETDPLELRSMTDGRPFTGVVVRLIDEDGSPVQPGEPGEIYSRGPDAMLGYLDGDLDAEFYSEDGWFRTSDVGTIDEHNALTITDRIKDIIVRGGENISAKEVEDHLHDWKDIIEAAVVGIPDELYGERACAFVLPAEHVTLTGMREFLGSSGLERFKWPEELVLVDDLPRTPSGKVRKRSLRENYVSSD
jgi:acyl-CoA synthetase (AMP-forming)/AMP-acid ligase II